MGEEQEEPRGPQCAHPLPALALNSLSNVPGGALLLVHLPPWFALCANAGDRFDPWVEDALEKGMATHSSVLAWRMPGTGEPGGLRVHPVLG